MSDSETEKTGSTGPNAAGTPSIVQVTYDAAQLGLTWAGAGITPGTACHVNVTNGAGQTTSYPATGTSAAIPVNLSIGGPWSVTVNVDGGATSTSVAIITTSGAITSVNNLGAAIDVAWTLAGGTSASYIELQQVNSGQGQGWLVSQTTYTIQQNVTGSGWQVSMRGALSAGMAKSYGPIVTVAVITASPAMTRVVNSGTDLQTGWTGVTGYGRYLVSLQQGSATPQTKSVQGFVYTFPVALTGSSWQVSAAAQSADQVSTGPPSAAVAVITAVPNMIRISYAPPNLTLNWTTAGTYQKYAATLWQGGNAMTQLATGNTTFFVGPFTGAGWNCAVRAQSSDGIAFGPLSSSYQPILVAPTFNTFAYDGSNVTVTWTNAQAANVTANYLSVTSGGAGASQPIGMTGSATFAATLQADLIYSAVVYASAGIVFGPPSPPLVPISAPPRAVYLGYDGTSLLAMWQAPSQTTPTNYQLSLTANGAVVASPQSASSPHGFGIDIAIATAYAVTVRAIAGPVTGPPNAPVSGPYAANQVFTFDGFGRVRAVAWNGQHTVHWAYDTAGNLLTQSLTSP